ncbi:uncharacterized protein LOC119311633 isoform X3 [Triticum dicoccoides]|uniref:uncharacterized protein LOC119311633 isoform X3 n=1 Tax=Triticum dicoccoides TaxID=85692 RepID=UPI000E7A655F|nr:uncharacterized protein LOC119311633 isoform X3 [Triticum dicoccoides]
MAHLWRKYENLKELLKPDFEDMVPQYSGTSTDLLKTVFNLMLSVTLFVGRFDMRMLQAAINKGPDESKSSDLLYDHLDGKDELLFDFIADAGDDIQIHARLHMSSVFLPF